MLLRGSLLLLVHLVPLLGRQLHNQDSGEDSGQDGEVVGGADHWGVTDHNADILEESNQVDVGSERDGRKYFIPKGFRPQFYNFNQPYSNPRVIRAASQVCVQRAALQHRGQPPGVHHLATSFNNNNTNDCNSLENGLPAHLVDQHVPLQRAAHQRLLPPSQSLALLASCPGDSHSWLVTKAKEANFYDGTYLSFVSYET